MFSLLRAARICASSSHIAATRIAGCQLGISRYPGSNHGDVQMRGKKSKAKRAQKKEASSAGERNVGMDDDNNSIDIAVIEADMTRVSEAFKTSLSRLRAVGAHPEMLDGVQVMAYGSRTYLKNVAQVAVKDARTLSVNVFDSDVTTSVEKGIRSSGLNLNPVVDGSTSIRVPVPRADKNSRETLVRNAMGEAEKAKIATRHVRRDAMNDIKKMKDSLAKSEVKRIEKDVQKSTDKFVQLIEKVTQDKVKAIRDV